MTVMHLAPVHPGDGRGQPDAVKFLAVKDGIKLRGLAQIEIGTCKHPDRIEQRGKRVGKRGADLAGADYEVPLGPRAAADSVYIHARGHAGIIQLPGLGLLQAEVQNPVRSGRKQR